MSKLVLGKVEPIKKEEKTQVIDKKFIVAMVEETINRMCKERLNDLIDNAVESAVEDATDSIKDDIQSDLEDNIKSDIMSDVEDMIDEKLTEKEDEGGIEEIKDVLNAIKDAIELN